ncbi:junctional adhesion molecule A [Carlito syrichta]|uniref:Junctional adhesion molecule A n=1 Tax=Carlito syrichta TaxID=1868482 RepID=A0A3Q0E999_CARSF|nr:junctional adhesion molecule A [Carlito syrichta]
MEPEVDFGQRDVDKGMRVKAKEAKEVLPQSSSSSSDSQSPSPYFRNAAQSGGPHLLKLSPCAAVREAVSVPRAPAEAAFEVPVAMGTKAKAARRHLRLFTLATLCSLVLGKSTVYTPESEVRIPENKTVKLSCSYSGFSSPRVEWKFVQGDTTSLVCYNNKITASYEDRVTFSPSDITFSSVTRKDNGLYTCMVSEEGGNNYGEVTVKLIVLVPPSKPTVSIPSSATIGNRVVLTCSEPDGSPPSEYSWFRDGVPMPTDPKNSRAFSNSSYELNQKSGELVFSPLSASDTGEYYCQAQNGYGTPASSAAVRMEAVELNVGGIVAAVLVTLILLGLLIFGLWFAYSRGYFDRKKKGTSSKKVIYSQPSARSEGEFKQTSSFLV